VGRTLIRGPTIPDTMDDVDGSLTSTRVDRWLWAVRVFKTRTEATDACRGGHVQVNDAAAKAATVIRVGDRVSVRTATRERDVEVARVIDKRVGPPIAAECLVDHTVARPPSEPAPFRRDRGAGRPTKRDRRDLDRFRAH
jgi:ribosome-associated heat shock protein Hsp15